PSASHAVKSCGSAWMAASSVCRTSTIGFTPGDRRQGGDTPPPRHALLYPAAQPAAEFTSNPLDLQSRNDRQARRARRLRFGVDVLRDPHRAELRPAHRAELGALEHVL